MPFTRRNTNRYSSRRSSSTTGSYRPVSFSTWSSRFSPTNKFNPVKFVAQRNEVTAKIQSFRTINEQLSGAGKVVAFSPSIVNRWINWVNDGCYVYKFNNNEFNRSFGRYFNRGFGGSFSTGTALRKLQRQFGAGIKAIARGKGNTWLVAASENITKGPFGSYWK
jgi:hypothetical protein